MKSFEKAHQSTASPQLSDKRIMSKCRPPQTLVSLWRADATRGENAGDDFTQTNSHQIASLCRTPVGWFLSGRPVLNSAEASFSITGRSLSPPLFWTAGILWGLNKHR
ncbi:hypothetical protein DPEC_G00026820 [Dallia pectoralis]|uniref:Uncharacterized protein n=1 Tax=Dallia pectoralis TaxID=75939 RepID=A0ACC2HHL8_DALPE|nr:hypothetical protein DPEC_G00026820 [Dallia pectoralis]